MILFLSSSFLRRFYLLWKPELRAFLIGQRNFFFFCPDSLFETVEITCESVDAFLQKHKLEEGWQLLGFVTPDDLPVFPGYAILRTAGSDETKDWSAYLHLEATDNPERHVLEIKVSSQSAVH